MDFYVFVVELVVVQAYCAQILVSCLNLIALHLPLSCVPEFKSFAVFMKLSFRLQTAYKTFIVNRATIFARLKHCSSPSACNIFAFAQVALIRAHQYRAGY